MSVSNTGTGYRRKQHTGTLRLGKVMDIFEAQPLLESSRKALNDTQATQVVVEGSQTERLDLSALQILLALQRDLKATDRSFRLEGLAENLTTALAAKGITF
ncbi:MAG TPA: STAS domain-containing protein [Chthonomonadaceae bacterium]|nr:STAS domain-containing protein [Chthonomonadaceae bacterium]